MTRSPTIALLWFFLFASVWAQPSEPWLHSLEQARNFVQTGDKVRILSDFLDLNVEGEQVTLSGPGLPERRLSKHVFRLCYRAHQARLRYPPLGPAPPKTNSGQLEAWLSDAADGDILICCVALQEGSLDLDQPDIHEWVGLQRRGDQLAVGYEDFTGTTVDWSQAEQLVQVLRSDENYRACRHNLKTVWTALEAYRKEHGDYPANLETLVGSGLTRAQLLCPQVRRKTYKYSPTDFVKDEGLRCRGRNHPGHPPNQPSYDSFGDF